MPLYSIVPILWLFIMVILADAKPIQEGRLTVLESLYYNFLLRLSATAGAGWCFWKVLGKADLQSRGA